MAFNIVDVLFRSPRTMLNLSYKVSLSLLPNGIAQGFQLNSQLVHSRHKGVRQVDIKNNVLKPDITLPPSIME